jgi:DNA repair photolyase
MKPATGTREWADRTYNIQAGCEHDCAYCYAHAMAVRFGRCQRGDVPPVCQDRREWAEPIVDMRRVKRAWKPMPGWIMFPSTHDITAENWSSVVEVARNMLTAGNRILLVTKPDSKVVETVCHYLRGWAPQVMWRFTIGSTDANVLALWEPCAPTLISRLAALRIAHGAGYQTSVSIEPMLDANPEAVVEAVDQHVTDTIWLGLPNRLASILALTRPGDAEWQARGRALMAIWTPHRLAHLRLNLCENPKVRWKDSLRAAFEAFGLAPRGE